MMVELQVSRLRIERGIHAAGILDRHHALIFGVLQLYPHTFKDLFSMP